MLVAPQCGEQQPGPLAREGVQELPFLGEKHQVATYYGRGSMYAKMPEVDTRQISVFPQTSNLRKLLVCPKSW
jgi:hypothetical protein